MAFIKRLDKDGDGKVFKPEFDGPPIHFIHLDSNRDGKIDANEAKILPLRPAPGRDN